MAQFVECGTVSVNYDRMGIAAVSYTIITSKPSSLGLSGVVSMSLGGISFEGYVTNVDITPISSVAGESGEIWAAASITMVATTN